MVAELKELGVETVVDTEGEPLIAALRAQPATVTPNVSEAEGAVGHEFNDREDYMAGVRELIELGANEAVVTREQGCVASLLDGDERRLFEVTAPAMEPVAAVGSGDAFLAGFVASRFDGGDVEQSLRFGVACGAESTQHFGAGTIDPNEVESLSERVEVNRLEATPAIR
jgi:1-phosphofructokinase/tagatose 6-phosphate kinase